MVRLSTLERLLARVLGAIHIALGVAVLAGGPDRFPPPNYEVLLRVTDGVVWPYGSVWILGGSLMFFCKSLWGRAAGVFVVIVLANVWAALFGIAAHENPTASYTPSVAYGGYALLNSVLLGLMYLRAKQGRHEVE